MTGRERRSDDRWPAASAERCKTIGLPTPLPFFNRDNNPRRVHRDRAAHDDQRVNAGASPAVVGDHAPGEMGVPHTSASGS